MQPSPTDLFGEVVVTLADIDRWLIHVPRNITPWCKRAAWYVANWAVPEKIRDAKIAGDFDELPVLERRRPWLPPHRYRAALEKPATLPAQPFIGEIKKKRKNRPARTRQDRLN